MEDNQVQNTVQEPKKSTWIDTFREYAELLTFVVITVLLITLFLFNHVVVDGPSMNKTLENGDHLIITRLFREKQGDIVVFEDEDGTGLQDALVKRVIATEYQTVRIYSDRILVNGEEIEEDYAYLYGNAVYAGTHDYVQYLTNHGVQSYLDDNSEEFVEYKVGKNQVFVMGDNRFNSNDSRFFGPISVDSIYGKVILRIYPFSSFGGVK